MDLGAFKPFNAGRHTPVALVGKSLFSLRGRRAKKLVDLDAALICCHGAEGENGTLQGVLEMAGIPHTSSGVLESAICMNKVRTKDALVSRKFKVLRGTEIRLEEFVKNRVDAMSKIVKRQGFTAIVKPASMGSSIGVRRVQNREELEEALLLAFALDDSAIVEREVQNKVELNCAAIGYDGDVFVSAVERPMQVDGVLTFEDKYLSGAKGESARQVPADIDESLAAEVRETTRRLYTELGLCGVVRVDYLMDQDKGVLLVNEINTVPGSLANYLFKPCGIDFSTLIDMAVSDAMQRAKTHKKDFAEYRNGRLLSGSICK
jgi:D-alanine-D-alanine ligase